MFGKKKDTVPSHLRNRIEEIRNRKPATAPVPWRELPNPLIGGLLEVGFSASGKYLLTVSWSGRGVFDCSSGEKLARDPDSPDDTKTWHDFNRLEAEGIGPISGERVRLCGIWGGGLNLQTADGWSLDVETFDWPIKTAILSAPESHGIFNIHKPFNGTIIERTDEETRAFGFSHTGKNLVLAGSNFLRIFRRDP